MYEGGIWAIGIFSFPQNNLCLLVFVNTSRNMRFCPFCINKIEDELHFLLECPCFEEHRTKFFHNIRNINILHLNKIDKFVTLMTNINVIPQTAQYITQTMHVREYLLKKHKNNS